MRLKKALKILLLFSFCGILASSAWYFKIRNNFSGLKISIKNTPEMQNVPQAPSLIQATQATEHDNYPSHSHAPQAPPEKFKKAGLGASPLVLSMLSAAYLVSINLQPEQCQLLFARTNPSLILSLMATMGALLCEK